jgi:hypothetical protein
LRVMSLEALSLVNTSVVKCHGLSARSIPRREISVNRGN